MFMKNELKSLSWGKIEIYVEWGFFSKYISPMRFLEILEYIFSLYLFLIVGDDISGNSL